jgi:nicotinamidase-related amidase
MAMPLTTLDPKTALIIVDLQKGIVGYPTVHPVDGIIKNASLLADTFRSYNLPVVLVNVDAMAPGRTEVNRRLTDLPEGWTDIVPELNRQPQDHLVTKRTWGAFMNTGLAEYLKNQNVTQIVIIGISTSSGVESTARQAYEHGFNVTLAIDAMTDMNLEVHTNSITRIFPKLGETGTTKEIVDLLENNSSKEKWSA